MDNSRLSADEIRAAAEVHHELGPGYRDAVVASFLETADVEIAARIDARLAEVLAAGPCSVARPRSSVDNRRALLRGLAIGFGTATVPCCGSGVLGPGALTRMSDALLCAGMHGNRGHMCGPRLRTASARLTTPERAARVSAETVGAFPRKRRARLPLGFPSARSAPVVDGCRTSHSPGRAGRDSARYSLPRWGHARPYLPDSDGEPAI